MHTRQLGSGGPRVSALGFGCMGLLRSDGTPDAESVDTLRRALDLGITFLDTADVYATGRNEEFVGRTIGDRRPELTIATKCGLVWDSSRKAICVNGRPEYVRSACEASLRRLGIDVIDLYFLHRVDVEVPIEDTIGALSELVSKGKVRFIGMSEVSAATLRRAHAIHPVTALQSEYSLWTRGIERRILPLCRELGIGVVPFSPLGRGFLTATLNDPQDFTDDDLRRRLPRFQGENFEQNARLVRRTADLAAALECSPAQIALAWLLKQGDDIVPIPGTRQLAHLEENIGSLLVTLTARDLDAIAASIPPDAVAGARYHDEMMQLVDR